MSLPRPGGQFGEKKSGSIYGGGSTSTSTSSAFAGYNPPSTSSQQHFGHAESNIPGQPGFSYSGVSRSGGGGGGGGGGAFGTGGAGHPQGFGGETPAGGALGRGANEQWDQYGFSNVGIGENAGGVGGSGMNSFRGAVGPAPGGAIGTGEGQGANRQGAAAGAGVGGQPPLDWHQWAPPGMNKQVRHVSSVCLSTYGMGRERGFVLGLY